MDTSAFKAYDIRGTYPQQFNEANIYRIGVGVGQFLKDHPERPTGGSQDGAGAHDTILVSRDMRASSPSLSESLIEGIRTTGMNVIDLGMCDTSFMYFAVNHLGAAGGVQVTASHNPPQYNGCKISGPLAKPVGGETGLKDIESLAVAASERGSSPLVGSLESLDLWAEYRKHILQFLAPLPRPTKVFIDASNGMAGKMIPLIFDGVENLEVIGINYEHTGTFVHDPNPLVAENMIPTQQGVKEHGAALGACFDGDADRCMLVDDQGEIIGCDHLTALLCDHFLQQAPGAAVVYDLRSSKVVEEEITAKGGKPVEGKVGHVNMKKVLRDTEGIFGGELSGHFYFRDNYYADSGAIAFCAVLSVLAGTDQSVSELVQPFRKYPQSGEINFKVEDKEGVIAGLKSRYGSDADVRTLDGVTIDMFSTKGQWFNVRASNTEPLLRFNAEARDAATLKSLIDEISPALGERAEGH